MKKIFISMPMAGKGKDDILSEQENILALVGAELQCDVELVESFVDNEDYSPLEFLGESLKRMAKADYVVFAEGYEYARGCGIERICAEQYGLEILEVLK